MGGGTGHHLFAQAGVRARIADEFCFHRRQAAVKARAKFHTDDGGVSFRVREK